MIDFQFPINRYSDLPFGTRGVYQLGFDGDHRVYIGSSRCIRTRLNAHRCFFRQERHTPDMMLACLRRGPESLYIKVIMELPDAPEVVLLEAETAIINRYLSQGKELFNSYIPPKRRRAA